MVVEVSSRYLQFVSSALIDLGPTSIDSSASSGLGLGPVELAGESSSEDKKEIKYWFLRC